MHTSHMRPSWLSFRFSGRLPMMRFICLLTAIGCLVILPGCSSCCGNSCRRPSFLEFRNASKGLYQNGCNTPCSSPCEPCGAAPRGCEPCGNSSPCCEGGIESGTVIGPTMSPTTAPFDDAPLLPATHRVLRRNGCSLLIRAVHRRMELSLGQFL